jgi:hypothetical protein
MNRCERFSSFDGFSACFSETKISGCPALDNFPSKNFFLLWQGRRIPALFAKAA